MTKAPPSYPSDIDVDDGGRVMLTGFAIPPAEYGAERYVHRLASGFDQQIP